MSEFKRTILFESDSLRLFLTHAPERRYEPVIFTFHGYAFDPRIQDSGFAEGFLANIGCDAIHFLTARNDWYQSAAIRSAIDAASAKAAAYSRRVSYGSSMGGYAACLYSHWLDVERAVAFAPQFAIGHDIVPAERRWQRERRAVDFPYDAMMRMAQDTPELLIVHDPTDPDDRMQIGLFRQMQNLVEFRIPLSGHEILRFLHEIGLLKEFIEATVLGTFDRAWFRAEIRRRRARSSFYLSIAAFRAASTGHRATARELLGRYDGLPARRQDSAHAADRARHLLR